MITTPGKRKFLGLDLNSFGRDLYTAWSDMLNWRVLSWLWPKMAVRLWLPDGVQMLAQGTMATPTPAQQGGKIAQFDAVLLPEELLLRRTFSLPRLQPAELQAALALEVQSLSPFTLADTVWAEESVMQDPSSLRADLVLAARKLIAAHIESRHPNLTSRTPEVWVRQAIGGGFLILPGYGEARRRRQGLLWRWASAMLVLLACAIMAMMAITPSIQLYLRASQAKQAMLTLQQKAGPVMAQRESMLRSTERLDGLTRLIGKPIPILQTIDLVTKALPDDTSLLSLKIQGAKITLSGQAPNAAALMKQLGATVGMRDVKAPVPAIKAPGATRESFTIEFMLDPVKTGVMP